MLNTTFYTYVQQFPGEESKEPSSRHLTRRSHRKSRNGCLQCKQRRIKCDEVRPRCSQCEHRGSKCAFSDIQQSPKPERQSPDPSSQQVSSAASSDDGSTDEAPSRARHEGSNIIELSAENILEGLSLSGFPAIAEPQSYMRMVSHFSEEAVTTVSSAIGQAILRDNITYLMLMYPFLLHATLAFSASHLALLDRGKKEFVQPALYHTRAAIRLYRERLVGRRKLQERDAIFAASILLTALFYFQDDEINPTANWFTASDTQTPPTMWTTLISGPIVLLWTREQEADMNDSVWRPMVEQIASTADAFGPSQIRVPPEVRDLCTCETSSYYTSKDLVVISNLVGPCLVTAQLLGPLIPEKFFEELSDGSVAPRIDPECQPWLYAFPARLSTDFKILLYANDPLAVALIATWFGLLSCLEHTRCWMRQRCRTEGLAMCSYLKSVQDGGRFDRIVELLMKIFTG